MPQRSVFRYPGGKTWFVPYLRQWLDTKTPPSEFIEPFAGGGIVGLTVAFEGMADHVVLVEKDEQVAAVWMTILSDDAPWLAERIESFDLSAHSVESVLAETSASQRELAFQTILRNRVNRGGILAPGAGKVKLGENGKGLASRWYPRTLSKRIRDMARVRDRITFIHGDGLEITARFAANDRACFFFDPPYTAGGKRAGARLYNYPDIDHEALFKLGQGLAGDFLMTYEHSPDVLALAAHHRLVTQPIAMKNTHHARMTELLIGRDLNWLNAGSD
ncbi:MAG: DNA adenine methylase [Anaerolineae bacterium]|nr:DNA adenine methylase [Anaerolineae bacterium]